MAPSRIRIRLRPITAALLGLVAWCGVLTPSVPAGALAQSKAEATHCKIRITGKKVAVRMPEGGAKVARPDSPVVRYVHRGDVITNRFCIIALGRTNDGPLYRKCGRDGYNWYIVAGGQVPVTCAQRVR
ncbi:hypothetical protein [Streptomyces vastus]|uniref:SH3 domain-containing protein n=1 Tax=Streptomyces vastus TaxID=285451 RepID=A0ABN3RQ07_9ACTN